MIIDTEIATRAFRKLEPEDQERLAPTLVDLVGLGMSEAGAKAVLAAVGALMVNLDLKAEGVNP